MELAQFTGVLLNDQQKLWKEGPAPGVLRSVASGVRDKDKHPIEHWCLVTAVCHAHSHTSFHPGEYEEAAEALHLAPIVAKAISMFGDGLLAHSHPLYKELKSITWHLLNRGEAN